MIYIKDDIDRLLICQWAYGWTEEELHFEIKKMIDKKQWEYYFNKQEENRKITENLILELKNKHNFENTICLFKEERNRSYGSKYIKRKNRY